jgi:hypothetical protein
VCCFQTILISENSFVSFEYSCSTGKAKVDNVKGTCGDSSVGRVEYDLDDRGIVFRLPIEKIFLFRNDHTGSSPHRLPVKSVPGPDPRWCGNGGGRVCEVDHSPSLPAERKILLSSLRRPSTVYLAFIRTYVTSASPLKKPTGIHVRSFAV